MRVFKNTAFQKFARKEEIGDATLCEAVLRAEAGAIDADLGGGVIKQRVARPGAGKSGGYRTLISFRSGDRAIFAFGFAKKEMDNIGPRDLRDLKLAARVALEADEAVFERLVETARLEEVFCGDQGRG